MFGGEKEEIHRVHLAIRRGLSIVFVILFESLPLPEYIKERKKEEKLMKRRIKEREGRGEERKGYQYSIA